MTATEYDYIIAGGGLAGLSLAHRLNRSSLRGRKILIIDRERKSVNDHTWCFWADESSGFEDVVFHRWKSLNFYSASGDKILLDLGSDGFEYRMIRASDFYSFVLDELKQNTSIDFVTGEIAGIGNGVVEVDGASHSARSFVFDSISLPDYDNPSDHNLVQHFLGRVVRTNSPVFDDGAATLFDFRIPQKGECRFIYVLPFRPDLALVEFTVFSEGLLEREEYENALDEYLGELIGSDDYEVVEEEAGAIPMSDSKHVTRPFDKTLRIGTAGGYVKPSTGYSFSRTQRRLRSLVADLEAGRDPGNGIESSGWSALLDSVLLSVLERGHPPASEIFKRLFSKNKPVDVLRFLDERTSLFEDLKIMSTVPLVPFTAATLKEIPRTVRRRLR